MQVFLPFKNVYLTAKCLDKRRRHKQIIECKQIMAALDGISKSWRNHPVTKMYEKHREFLNNYLVCLELFHNGLYTQAKVVSDICKDYLPSFITDEYCDNMKRRLFTKDPIFYKDFAIFGKSYENWYFDIENNNWKIYKQNN